MFLMLPALRAQDVHELTDVVVELRTPLLKTNGSGNVLTQSSLWISEPFNGLILNGMASGRIMQGSIRFWEKGTWSDAEPLRITMAADGAHFAASYRSDRMRQNTHFEVQLGVADGQRIAISEAGLFNNALDEERLLMGRTIAANLTAVPRFPAPRVIRRSEWGARAYNCSNGVPDPQPSYSYLTLHHTAWPVAQTLEASYKNMKDIQTFHIVDRGWCDIGYQFLMDQKGNLFQGRPWMNEKLNFKDVPQLVIGAHVSNGNTGNIGLSLMGCFHPPENTSSLACLDTPSTALVDSVVAWFTFMADAYGVKSDNIRGHRDFNTTSCPGDNNYVLLSEIRSRVQKNLNKPPAAVFAQAGAALTPGERTEVNLSWTVSNEGTGVTYAISRKNENGQVTNLGTVSGTQSGSYTYKDQLNTCDQKLTYTVTAKGTDQTDVLVQTETLTRPSIGGAEMAVKILPSGLVDVDWAITSDEGIASVEVLRLQTRTNETATHPGEKNAVVYAGETQTLDSAVDRGVIAQPGLQYQLVLIDAAGCRQTAVTGEPTSAENTQPLLAPPYPNPFNPSTTVRYYVPETSHVQVRVFDVSGRLVKTLADTHAEGARWFVTSFDAAGLASGSYLITLDATNENGQTTRKIQRVSLIR